MFVQVWSKLILAEIFHYTETWKNVAGTNVAWSNVPLYVFINYRDPKKLKIANPVVDIAASSQIGVLFGLASWQVGAGLQSN